MWKGGHLLFNPFASDFNSVDVSDFFLYFVETGFNIGQKQLHLLTVIRIGVLLRTLTAVGWCYNLAVQSLFAR